MKRFLLFSLVIFLLNKTFAQPAVQWQKVLGGTLSDYRTYAVDTTLDGGYIIAGNYAYGYFLSSPTGQTRYTDGFMARFDAAGTLLWKKTYPGNRNDGISADTSYNGFNSVQHTADGGFIAVGANIIENLNSLILVVKTNAVGDTLWERNVSREFGGVGYCVKQTTDGGYIIAGYDNDQRSDVLEQVHITRLDASGNILWEKSYGGEYAITDIANAVAQTPDGGFIVAGYSASGQYTQPDGDVTVANHGGFDYWILKLDISGNISWQKMLGGTGSDNATSIDVTSDGGYIVAGYSTSADGDLTGNKGGYDYWVVKLDNAGTIAWQKNYGGSGNDIGYAVKQTRDGNYIVAGYGNSSNGDITNNHGAADAWILKLNTTGGIIFQNSIGSTNSEGIRGIVPTATGFIMAGTNNSKNYNSSGYLSGDYWLLNVNTSGNIIWQDINGASGGSNNGRSVAQAADGGFVYAGYGNSVNVDISGAHGGNDALLFKTDNNGALQWSKALGGSRDDYIASLIKTTDGGFIAAGTTTSVDGDVTTNKGNSDYWVVKLSATGAIQWQKTYGGSLYDSATAIQQTTDGGYIVAGRSSSINGDVTGNHGDYDYWVIKLDVSGNLLWQKSYGGTGADYPYSIKQTADGGFVVGGRSTSSNGDLTINKGGYDYWIIKLNATGTLLWQKSLGGSSDDLCYSVIVTNNGDIVAAGSSTSEDGDVTGLKTGYDYPDFWIVKLNSVGNLVWQKTYGSTDYEAAYSIVQAADGNYVIAGVSGAFGDIENPNGDVTVKYGLGDVWVIKIDTANNLIWQKSFGGSSGETGVAIIQSADGSYEFTGITASHDGDVNNNPGVGSNNVWVVKLTADVLPVTLLNFDGLIKDNAALLTWRTATENNNKGFEVQKSYDGSAFTDLGFVKGAGTSSLINTYNYTDFKVTSGNTYYRLKQVDFDGKIALSNTIKLDYSKFAWSVLVNPFAKNTVLQLQLDKAASVSVQVLSVSGAVYTIINKGKINSGTYSIPVDLSNNAPGGYIIKLLVNDKIYTQKVIKN